MWWTMGRIDSGLFSDSREEIAWGLEYRPSFFTNNSIAARASRRIFKARMFAPVREATSSAERGSQARRVKRFSSAPVSRTRLSMKFRANSMIAWGVGGFIAGLIF